MPYFTPDDLDIDVDEFLSACSSREIKEIIKALVEDDHLPKSVLGNSNPKEGRLQSDFSNKIEMLKEKYYSISNEDEQLLENIFKKYL